MEEADRNVSPKEEPEVWARLAPGALAQNRQAFLAAWMAGRALRRRLAVRLAVALAALAALLGTVAWAPHALLNGTPVAPWQCLLPPLLERALGLRIFLSRGGTSDYVLVGYAQYQNRLIGSDPQDFAYPAMGEPKFQWFSSRCCAVTYPSADGSIQVQLLEPLRGDVLRLDPPVGEWTGEDLVSGAPVTLRWDEADRCYHLLTSDKESVYRQWEDFDGLGIALCNDKGLPEWTVTPSISPLALLFNGETVSTLELCPVSMEDTQSLLLYSADDKDTEESTPESADLTAR